MDGLGREIRLLEWRELNLENLPDPVVDQDGGKENSDRPIYLAIEYHETKTHPVKYDGHPKYSGHTRITEDCCVKILLSEPDNYAQLELARIQLKAGATEVFDPQDPDNPQENEIDRQGVSWTGPQQGAETMAQDVLQQLIQVMQRTRRDFAALAGFMPVPSASDVRHGALTLEMLARTGYVTAGRLSHVIVPLVAAARDVEQELGAKYGPILDPTTEFRHYRVALQELEAALGQGQEPGILNAQDAVAEAARELAEMIVESPIAEAGRDQTVTTYEKQATVTLDASASQARSGREIVRYHWTHE